MADGNYLALTNQKSKTMDWKNKVAVITVQAPDWQSNPRLYKVVGLLFIISISGHRRSNFIKCDMDKRGYQNALMKVHEGKRIDFFANAGIHLLQTWKKPPMRNLKIYFR
jgi:hypothetical protein